jgi:uncharacterized membrane protein
VGARWRWITPLTLVVTLVAAIMATTPKEAGLSANTWEAAFWIAAAGSAVWLLISLVSLVCNWKDSSIDSLISKIKPPDVIPDKD